MIAPRGVTRHGRWPRTPRASAACLLVALLIIAAATLRPAGDASVAAWCLSCILAERALLADFIANVVLFIPLGAGLRAAGVPLSRALFAGAVASLGVEVLQATVVVGRHARVTDLVSNTLGTAAGFRLADLARVLLMPRRILAGRLAAGALLGLAVIPGLSVWLLEPVTPETPLRVRGIGSRPAADARGTVLAASLDGQPLRPDEELFFPPHGWPVHLEAVLTERGGADDPRPVVRLTQGRTRHLVVGRADGALVVELRRRSTELRLQTPRLELPTRTWRAPTAMPPGRVPPLQAAVDLDRWVTHLVVTEGTRRATGELALHPFSGWALLLPYPRSRAGVLVRTTAWAFFLVLPAAYWCTAAARRYRRPAIGAAPVAVVALASWGIPFASGAPAAPWPGVVACCVSLLAGAAVQRAVSNSARHGAMPRLHDAATLPIRAGSRPLVPPVT